MGQLSVERKCVMCQAPVLLPRSPFCSVSCNKKGSYWKKPDHYRAKAREWGDKHPEAKKAAVVRFAAKHGKENVGRRHTVGKYGMTLADYDNMLDKQGSKCAACGASEPGKGRKYFDIDHNHRTGKVRGLLCVMCNRGLGMFGDNSERLRLALMYLMESGGIQ